MLKRGSTLVEATLIFPLLILIIFGIIRVSLVNYDRVCEESLVETETEFPESILRAKWIIQ